MSSAIKFMAFIGTTIRYAIAYSLDFLILPYQVRLIAVGCAIVGVSITTIGATEEGDGSDGWGAFWGCFLAVAAAALAALYKVLFYQTFGEASPLQVRSFMPVFI